MAIERSSRSFSAARIRRLTRRLLDASTLCAIATVSAVGQAHINTAYFAWNSELDVVWLSAPDATHSQNLRTNATASVAVYDSHQSWGTPDRGIQLFGSAREAVGGAARECERLYAKRFREYVPDDMSAYRFYRFRPRRMKLFDEAELGAGVFVTASVGSRGTIAWKRTEIYHASSSLDRG